MMSKALTAEEQKRRGWRMRIVNRRIAASQAPAMPELHVTRIDRALDYKLDIEGCGFGRTDAQHSIAEYTRLEGGVLVKHILGHPHHALVVQSMGRCNVFVDPPLSVTLPWIYYSESTPRVNVQAWHNVTLSETEVAFYEAAGRLAIKQNIEFFDRQCRWYRTRPWEQLYGLTPEAAVAKLEEMGW